MQRPTGVTVLAVLAAIGGIFGLFGGLALIGLGGLAGALSYGEVGSLAVIGGLLVIILSIVELALAYGFWMLRPWAWQLGIVLAVINVVRALLGVVGFVFYDSVFGAIITIAIAGAFLYYLNMPDIRRAFGAPEKGWPFVGTIGS